MTEEYVIYALILISGFILEKLRAWLFAETIDMTVPSAKAFHQLKKQNATLFDTNDMVSKTNDTVMSNNATLIETNKLLIETNNSLIDTNEKLIDRINILTGER